MPETNIVVVLLATRCPVLPHAAQRLGVGCVMPPVPSTEDGADIAAAAAANAALGRALGPSVAEDEGAE